MRTLTPPQIECLRWVSDWNAAIRGGPRFWMAPFRRLLRRGMIEVVGHRQGFSLVSITAAGRRALEAQS